MTLESVTRKMLCMPRPKREIRARKVKGPSSEGFTAESIDEDPCMSAVLEATDTSHGRVD